MMKAVKGFFHSPTDEQLAAYARWPVERRLAWLQAGNELRLLLPRRIIEIQEKFRQGKI